MKLMQRMFLCALLGVAVLAVMAGCARKDVAPMEFGTTVPDSSGMTQNDVGDAILRAGIDSHWVLTPVSDGRIDGLLNYRDQTVNVTITYDDKSYRVHYAGSDNRNVRQHNKWMKNLDARIRKELLRQTRPR